MELWQAYFTPLNVDDALETLRSYAGEAQIVAGGTDLMVDLQYSDHSAAHPLAALVDVTRIAEMTRIEVSGDYLIVGAAAPTPGSSNRRCWKPARHVWSKAAAWSAGRRCATSARWAATWPTRCRPATARPR